MILKYCFFAFDPTDVMSYVIVTDIKPRNFSECCNSRNLCYIRLESQKEDKV